MLFITEAINLLEKSVLENIRYIHKKDCLNFQSIQDSFLLLFLVYKKTVDSMDIYKSLKINIETVVKSRELLKSVPDHLKTKQMCKHVFKKLPYLLRCVTDQYKTQKICDKVLLENGNIKPVSHCYKNQEMCSKAAGNYPHSLEFVPECFMTQENV